jgi:hypothetical protein
MVTLCCDGGRLVEFCGQAAHSAIKHRIVILPLLRNVRPGAEWLYVKGPKFSVGLDGWAAPNVGFEHLQTFDDAATPTR